MSDAVALSIAQQATQLRRAYPKCTALEALDAALEGRHGMSVDFGDLTQPQSPFGQLIAEAFDQGMDPQDWIDLTGHKADSQLMGELHRIWRTYVLPRFFYRYGLVERAD